MNFYQKSGLSKWFNGPITIPCSIVCQADVNT
jgi:hypothetical protein